MKITLMLVTLGLSLFSTHLAQEQTFDLPGPTAPAATDLVAMNSTPSALPESSFETTVNKPLETKKDFAKIEQSPADSFEPKRADSSGSDRNKFELFAGYSGASLSGSEPLEHGFDVSGVYYFHRYIGAKVEASGTFKRLDFDGMMGDHSLYNLTGGVQFKDSSKNAVWKPFAHVLFGLGQHKDKYTGPVDPIFAFDFDGFSTVIGGGLDVKVHRNIDIRVIQADINPIYYKQSNGASSIYSNFRFSAGIVFTF